MYMYMYIYILGLYRGYIGIMEKKMETTTIGVVGVYKVGDCQNFGPFLDPYYNTAPNIEGTQKGAIILTTTHM